VPWLKAHGLPHLDIAKLAACSVRSVRRYLDEFEQGGLALVRRFNWKGKPNALAEHPGALDDYFLANPPTTAKQAQRAIRERIGIHGALSQVRTLLKKGRAEVAQDWRGSGEGRPRRAGGVPGRRATALAGLVLQP
jgi:transposase